MENVGPGSYAKSGDTALIEKKQEANNFPINSIFNLGSVQLDNSFIARLSRERAIILHTLFTSHYLIASC